MADFIGPVKKSGYKPPKRKLTWEGIKSRVSHRMQVRLSYVFVSCIYAAIAGLILVIGMSLIAPLFSSALSGVFGNSVPTFEPPISSIYKGSDVSDGPIIASQLETPMLNRQFALLYSEELEINSPVYCGSSKRVLANGISFDSNGAMPGENSNVYLNGYGSTYLDGLRKAEKDDIITLTTNYGYFRYKVTKTEVLSNDAASKRNISIGNENLIISIPYPFEVLSDSSHETFRVYAQKVSGPSALAE